jgi:hypothetical protein
MVAKVNEQKRRGRGLICALNGGVLLVILFSILGCGPALYDLPPAPPKEQWISFSSADPEDKQGSVERFLASKKVAIELYAALSDKKWPEALAMMSQETRNFLEDSSNGKGALGALEAGELAFAGQVARFRPAADFFIADLAGIKDALPNAPAENETKLRKELYAINSDGQARKILFIYEADAWRFHSPFLGTPILAAAPSP